MPRDTLADLVDEAGDKPKNLWSPVLRSAEIFDPDTGEFTPVSPMAVPRRGHSATVLPDGRVLIAGGRGANVLETLDSTEIFDPATGEFTSGAKMPVGRDGFDLIPQDDGTLLAIGGGTEGGYSTPTEQVDRYLPGGDLWASATPLHHARRHPSIIETDGRLIVAGGNYGCCDAERTQLASTTYEILGPDSSSIQAFELPTAVSAPTQNHQYRFVVNRRPAQILTYTKGLWSVHPLPDDVLQATFATVHGETLVLGTHTDNLQGRMFSFSSSTGIAQVGEIERGEGTVPTPLPDGRILLTGGSRLTDEYQRSAMCDLVRTPQRRGVGPWELSTRTGMPPFSLALTLHRRRMPHTPWRNLRGDRRRLLAEPRAASGVRSGARSPESGTSSSAGSGCSVGRRSEEAHSSTRLAHEGYRLARDRL